MTHPPRFGSISRQSSQEGNQPNLNSLRYASASLRSAQRPDQQQVMTQQPSTSGHHYNRRMLQQQYSQEGHERGSSISSDEETEDSIEYLSDSSSSSTSSCSMSCCCPSCISNNCNSQICCSYVIGGLSSALIVGGIYLSLILWNRLWMSISVFGFVLVFFGAALFYCGSSALNKKQRRNRQETNRRSQDNGRQVEAENNRRRPYSDQSRVIGKRRRPERRTLSHLSLNMIPQYFAPADTCQGSSSIRESGRQSTVTTTQLHHNVSRSNTLLTTASVASSNSRNDSQSVVQGRSSVPFTQIFSLNGQSFLILPVEVPPTTGSSVMTSVSQRNSLAMEGSIPLDSLVVNVADSAETTSGLFRFVFLS